MKEFFRMIVCIVFVVTLALFTITLALAGSLAIFFYVIPWVLSWSL